MRARGLFFQNNLRIFAWFLKALEHKDSGRWLPDDRSCAWKGEAAQFLLGRNEGNPIYPGPFLMGLRGGKEVH